MKNILSQLNTQVPRNRQVSEPSPNHKLATSPLNLYRKTAAGREKQTYIKKQLAHQAGGSLGDKVSPPKAENSKILSSILNYQKSQGLSNLAVQPQHKQVVIQLQLDKENQPQLSQLSLKSEQTAVKVQHQHVGSVEHSNNRMHGFQQPVPNCSALPLSKRAQKCRNHVEKPVKYRISGQAVCSQCAVNYAVAKGLAITVLRDESKLLTFGQEDDDTEREDLVRLKQVHSDDTSGKLNSIEQFIRKLNGVLRESRNATQYMQLQKSDHQQQLQQQLEQVVQNLLKKPQYDQEFVAIAESVSKYTKDAECIKKDILDNVQNIVQYMETGPFNLIIGKYRDKLRQFESHLEQYSRKVQQTQSQLDAVYARLLTPEFQNQLESLVSVQMQGITVPEPKLRFGDFTQATSPPPVKYMELLNKVNQTQASTTMFYNSILTRTPNHHFKENGRYKTEIPKFEGSFD